MSQSSSHTITVRRSTMADLEAVDTLLARSYPAQLKKDYPPSVLVTAVPIIARAQPALLGSGRYFVAQTDEGAIVAAGGWSTRAPQAPSEGGRIGHVRHVVTDHRMTRRGIGRALMTDVMDDASRQGVRQMLCQSTFTAEAFYGALGFRRQSLIEIELRAGIVFPAVMMMADL